MARQFVSTTRFLSYVSRIQEAIKASRKRSRSSDEPALVLATVHACKGREWQNVWFSDISRGRLPHQLADAEEERRIFYVGVTRAKDRLVLSSGDVPSQYLDQAKALIESK
ncbi:MAG: ATP-dependent helicase [Deltaproteobacteria bacterium]|nr:MAG: ATP-dependent helicase [Deltaproteobacteria bacterium]